VKPKLEILNRAALLGLVQNLHAARKENQAFLHARFGFYIRLKTDCMRGVRIAFLREVRNPAET
jgi:hypothetical protein